MILDYEEQRPLLLEILNNAAINGRIAEDVVRLKVAIATARVGDLVDDTPKQELKEVGK